MEDIRNQLRRKVTDNHAFHELQELIEALEEWLRDWATRPRELLRLIGIDPDRPALKLQQPVPAITGPERL